MRQVNALSILGNPRRIDVVENFELPTGRATVSIYEDGTVIDAASGDIYSPEPNDKDLWNMRTDFDKANGIQPSDRVLLPVMTANNITFNRNLR